MPFEVTFLEEVDAEDEHGQHQRAEDDPHEPEQRQADEHAEDGDERMGVGQLFLHDEPHHVVDVGNDDYAVGAEPDGRAPAAVERHVGRQRQPYEPGADDGDDGGEAGDHAPEQRAGRPENQIARVGHNTLYDGQQRDADGVGADYHADFAHDLAPGRAVEWQHFAHVLLHPAAAYQHEIEYEKQHDQVDGEVGDALDYPLPDFGQAGQQRLEVVLLPEVVAGALADQFGGVAERCDDRLRVERNVLDADDEHPDDQADGNQKQEDGFGHQQRRGCAPPPMFPLGEVPHLSPQQHVDGDRAEQAAQKRGQLDENRDAEAHDECEKRITPVFFPE